MQQGVLYFERQTERMDIRFENKEIYGGLHCGTAMEVLINDEWIPTRIEYGNDSLWQAEIMRDNSRFKYLLPSIFCRIQS